MNPETELNFYYQNLEEIRKLKSESKATERLMHKKYLELNKSSIRWMDICFILIILFNLGAVLITNALVMKVDPGEKPKQLVEANIVMAKSNGYVAHPEGSQIISALFKQSITWAVLIGGYIYKRSKIYTDEGYYFLWAVVFLYMILTGKDFINDLGYMIGHWLFR